MVLVDVSVVVDVGRALVVVEAVYGVVDEVVYVSFGVVIVVSVAVDVLGAVVVAVEVDDVSVVLVRDVDVCDEGVVDCEVCDVEEYPVVLVV